MSDGKTLEKESDRSFSSRVSLNMVTNMARAIVLALVGLLMVPYYIEQFGMEVYGLLPLATSITTYVLIASDSLVSSFSRYLIIAIQSGDEEKANVTYSSSMIGMFRAVMKILPVAILIAIISPYVFQIGPADALDVQIMFALILVSALIVSFVSCLNSVFYSYNLLYSLYLMKIIYTLSQVGLIILFFVTMGPSLIMIGVSYLIASLIYLVMMFIGVRRICPFLHVSKSKYDKKLLGEMSRLGFWAMASSIGTMMFIQTSLVLVNMFLGPGTEAEFAVVANIISIINTACIALGNAGEPLVYRYNSEKDKEMVKHTLDLFTKLVGLIVVFPIAYICLFTPQLLVVWIHDEYEYIVPMTRLMVPVNIAVCAMYIMNCVFLMYAKMRQVAIATCLFGLVNIGLACIFLPLSGNPMGASIPWAISMLMLNLVFIPYYIAKTMGLNRLTFVKPIILCYVVFAVLMGIGWFVSERWTMPSSILWIVSTVVVGFAVYFVFIFVFLLNKREKGTVLTYFPQSIQNLVHKII